MLGASLLIVLFIGVRARDLLSRGSGSVPVQAGSIRYSVVAGDTPSSIAATFALDPSALMHEIGVSSADVTLAPGTQLTVDGSRLWTYMTQGALAPTESLVESSARRMGVEPALAVAVAWQESSLRETARSPTGAIGIMQVEPDTSSLAAQDLGRPIDARIASDNVAAGLFWLHSLLASYNGDQASALAAYYEGPGNLARRGYLQGTAEYVAHAQQLRLALLAAAPNLA